MFEEPCDAYKLACAKTIYLHRVLQGKPDHTKIEMPVFNALTLVETSVFVHEITAADVL